MIISDYYKFIFVHVQKTGGTSIRSYFDNNIKDNRLVGYQHDSALRSRKHEPELWNKYHTFAVVRNPWDRMVSRYFWSKEYQKNLLPECSTFKKFVKRVYNGEMISNNRYIQEKALNPQSTLVCDESGAIMMDTLLRFENLQVNFDDLCKLLKIPCRKLSHKNKMNRKKYRDYYDSESRKMIEKIYQSDVEIFDYEF